MMKTINKRNKHHINMNTIKEIVMSQRQKRKANLSGANLREANLIEANLSGANLIRANLREANLRGADLIEANLSGANLSVANLIRANLSGADLSGADLIRANLMEADLSGADLSGADLSGADLRGADLSGAKNIYVFTAYGTSKRIVYCVKHKYTWYVKAGCFWGTIKQLKDKVLSTHKSKVYLHNIALLEQL